MIKQRAVEGRASDLSIFSSATGDGGLWPLEQALYFSMFFGLAFDRVWPALAEFCKGILIEVIQSGLLPSKI